MPTPHLPQGQPPATSEDASASELPFPDRSRLEETLVKGSIWKKQTLRDIERNRALAANEATDPEAQTARLFFRLSAQLDERNEEIERLRRVVSQLQNEKSELGRAHQQELEQRQAEFERLQDAYDQFERESDSLLTELGQRNERLIDKVRLENSRSLPK